VQPDPCLRLTPRLWAEVTTDLHRRTEGRHESGVFLLGRKSQAGREALAAIYYDELDPNAYARGICILHADAFGRLWRHCEATGMSVVADIHVHALGAGQSRSDRENPMIARPGHLALILPDMARPPIRPDRIGIYEYLGDHQWRAHGGRHIARSLKIEDPA
jgi:hypothetical protein